MNLLQKLNQRARQLKSEAQVLMIAYKDKRKPASAKNLGRHHSRLFTFTD